MVPSDELEDLDEPRRRPALRWIAALLAAILFIALLGYGLTARAPSEVETGGRAPTFDLALLGEPGRLSSAELRGKPVVLNFWASWCIPCREEAPLLEQVWRRYRKDGVVIVGVNIRDSESDAKAFVKEFDVTYPMVRDTSEELARDLGVVGLPETFFLDHEWRFIGSVAGEARDERQGTVVLGAISEDQLVDNIEILLRRRAGTSATARRKAR